MIYWQMYEHDKGFRFLIAATEVGLCFTGSDGQGVEELERWAAKKRRGEPMLRDEAKMQSYKEAFDAFFDGESKQFSCPLDVAGTAFQQQVWQALQEIPFGRTLSYGEIASKIGKSSAVRAVGGAIGANPVMIIIPCHRVIGKNGTLTGFRGGLQLKKQLLSFEGIDINN